MKNVKLKSKIEYLPKSSGVYMFYDRGGNIIYIGKATVLKHRVSSYFIGMHDNKTEKLISEIVNINWQTTPSVIEAVILESNLIKKYKPKYNILDKDDRSFVQISLTKEEYPRLIPLRPTDKKIKEIEIKKLFGPYTNAASVKEILHIFRRIFTFRDCSESKFRTYQKKSVPCLFYPLNLCPAPCIGKISKREYLKIIKQMTNLLDGKKKRTLSSLIQQMKYYSKMQMYEQAAIIRNKIYAFQHINDIALIKNERSLEQMKNIPKRIEAYDISNISGRFTVGSMVVFSGGEIDKSEYRKFRIKNYELGIMEQNDPKMIGQIIERRLNHLEWPKPDLILIDGGKGQLLASLKALKHYKLKIPVITLAKGPTRKGYKLFRNSLAKKIILEKKFLLSIRDEAHRFAINYHRKLRGQIISIL